MFPDGLEFSFLWAFVCMYRSVLWPLLYCTLNAIGQIPKPINALHMFLSRSISTPLVPHITFSNNHPYMSEFNPANFQEGPLLLGLDQLFDLGNNPSTDNIWEIFLFLKKKSPSLEHIHIFVYVVGEATELT
jgi:hypothetical protein